MPVGTNSDPVKWVETFDTYGTSTDLAHTQSLLLKRWATVSNCFVVNSDRNSRVGQINGNLVTPSLTSAYTATWYVGFAFYRATTNSFTVQAYLGDDTSVFKLYCGLDSLFYFQPLSGGVVVTDSGNGYATHSKWRDIKLYRWYYCLLVGTFTVVTGPPKTIEVTGAQLWVNGENVLSLHDTLTPTGIGTNVGVTKWGFHATIEGNHYVDDIIIATQPVTFTDLGGTVLTPIANGTSVTWTASNTGTATLSNYECVDEGEYNITDWVQSGTSGSLDVYDFTALATDANVHALSLSAYINSTNTGSGAAVAPAMAQGTSTYTGVLGTATEGWVVASSTSYLDYIFPLSEDPVTSTTWVTTDINSAEFGVYQRDEEL